MKMLKTEKKIATIIWSKKILALRVKNNTKSNKKIVHKFRVSPRVLRLFVFGELSKRNRTRICTVDKKLFGLALHSI